MDMLITAALLAFASGLIGGYIPLVRKKWDEKTLKTFIGFSAGLLISIALVHMLPEVGIADTYLFVLIGFGCFYFIEQYIMLHSCPEPGCEFHEIGKLAFLGISFHSLIDGIAMGAGFALSEQLGVLITLAILVHKAPTGFSLSSIMINGEYKRGEIIRFLIIFSLMVPIGAILSNYVLSGVQSIVIESAIAFSAGTFLYIGIGDLLPEAHKTRRMSIVVAVLIGMFAGSASTFIGI